MGRHSQGGVTCEGTSPDAFQRARRQPSTLRGEGLQGRAGRCSWHRLAAGHPLAREEVVTEVAYFLAGRLGTQAERAFAESLERGELAVEPVEPSDWGRITQLLDEYEDLGIGIVDASVVATCERLDQTRLATLDRRHFAAIRPRHCIALELLTHAP